MDAKLNIGEKVRSLRKRSGMSQLELEIAISCSNGMISRIETNEVNPTKETLFRIAEALKLNGPETASLFGLDYQPLQSGKTEGFNIKHVLDLTTSKWVNVLGVSYAVIFLWNEEDKSLKVTSITIPNYARTIFERAIGTKIEEVSLFMSNPIHRKSHYCQSIIKKEMLITHDVKDFAESVLPVSMYKTAANILGMKLAINIPLIVQDKVLGVLGLIWPEEDFTEQDRAMVDTFAEQASITIYNAQLLSESPK